MASSGPSAIKKIKIQKVETFVEAAPDKKMVCKEIFVGGLSVKVHFRKDKIDLFRDPPANAAKKTVKFFYLLHGRKESELEVRKLALRVFEEYYRINYDYEPHPLVIFTWDQRNHGTRKVVNMRNEGWADGNDFHAQDMLSMIDAGVMELKSIVDYAPAYLPFYPAIGKVVKIVGGVSMGGHITIRAVTRFPGLFDAAVPFIGSFDLTTMMLKRLAPDDIDGTTLYILSYGVLKDRLGASAEQFPEYLFKLVAQEDSNVSRFYDTRKLQTLALFGVKDTLVPFALSRPFLEAVDATIQLSTSDVDYAKKFNAVVYPGCGHTVCDEMTVHCAKFLYTLCDPEAVFP